MIDEQKECGQLINALDGSRCANQKGKCIMHDTCDVLTEVDEHMVMKCHELKPCKIHGTYREGYDVALKEFAAIYKRDEEFAFDNGYIKAVQDAKEVIRKNWDEEWIDYANPLSDIIKILGTLETHE